MIGKFISSKKIELTLVLFSLFFCHHLYSFAFTFEGDANYNFYFWMNSHMLVDGYNPYHFDYLPSLTIYGDSNPFLFTVKKIISLFTSNQALNSMVGNMFTGFFLLTSISLASYYLFRALNLNNQAAFFGSIVSSYTGFQIVGVREFDLFYLQSYFFLICSVYLVAHLAIHKKGQLVAFCALILCVQLSFLGGSSSPFFFFAPLFFIMPIYVYYWQRSKFKLFQCISLILIAIIIGLLLCPSIFIRGAEILEYMNRGNLVFISQEHVTDRRSFGFITLLESFFQNLLFRDWIKPAYIASHYHERDFYFGIPVVALTLFGFVKYIHSELALSKWNEGIKFEKLVPFFFIACILFGFVVINIYLFPKFIYGPISFYMELASIRGHERFGMLFLLPFGYFSGLAIQSKSKKLNIAIFLVCVFAVVIAFNATLLGLWDLKYSLFKQNFIICMLLTSGTVIFLLLYINTKNYRNSLYSYAVTFMVFLTFTYAQYPVTAYSNNYYLNHSFNELSQNYFGKKNFLSLLGFSFDYFKSYDLIIDRYTKLPSDIFLKNKSEIFYDKTGFSNYSSNFIKHNDSDVHIAFALIGNPATHVLVQKLYNKLNEYIKSVVGITSEVGYLKSNHEAIPFEYLKIGADPNLTLVVSNHTESNSFIRFYQNAIKLNSQDQIYNAMTDVDSKKLGSPLYLLINQSKNDVDIDTSVSKEIEPLKLDYQYKDGTYYVALQSNHDGYVFLPIPFVKNWKAYVDGIEVEIFRANFAFMAVKTNTGDKNLILKIDRNTYYISRNISWILSLILFVIIFRYFRLLSPKAGL